MNRFSAAIATMDMLATVHDGGEDASEKKNLSTMNSSRKE